MKTHVTDLVDDKVMKIKQKQNIFDSGKVINVKDYIVEISGLENVKYFEKIIIMGKAIGYVNAIYENSVNVAIIKEDKQVEIGDIASSTGTLFRAIFSDDAIGRITDIFGVDQLSGKPFEHFRYVDIEKPNIPIMDRTKVCRPLYTGIAGIDLIYPIGKGQRQLIIGDKKTGKTQIALDTIVHQGVVKNKNGMVCIYIAIGKTKKEIKQIYYELMEKNALKYTTIIAATNDTKTPVSYLVPYVGMSIADEYMKDGRDVLVVIDDLRKHAEIYREMSLISDRTPGREAYPSDIFYVHARLLEKGCQHKNGGSITILPIVETKGGDITDYISTNDISITDGQIVLSSKEFMRGQLPAIDYRRSVSRLGGAVQKPNLKKLGAKVKLKLLSYLETKDVYGLANIDEMGSALKEKLEEGADIENCLRQFKFSPMSNQKIIQKFQKFDN